MLGSINLSEYVDEDGDFMYEELELDVDTITKAMNDVLDEGIPLHPLKEQSDMAREWRQIGIGIMGVADMLVKMGIRYGSQEAVDLCDNIAEHILNYALTASSMLAAQYGPFEKYDYRALKESQFYQHNVWPSVNDTIEMYGLRNSQVLTIAPTGTLSSMLRISGGVEPYFAFGFNRKTESLHGKDVYYKEYYPTVKEYMTKHGITKEEDLPDFFVTSQSLDYHERIAMQSAWQQHIDASISSTVNLPNSATPEQVFDLYAEASKAGLKGITVFRDGCRRAAILTTDSSKPAEDEVAEEAEAKFDHITPVSRKTLGVTHGNTYCKKCACGTLYITVNRDNDGNVVESFVNVDKKGICKANVAAVNRLISLSMRSGVKIDEIIDQIRGIDCPACTKSSDKRVLSGLSCPDIIARTIKEFYEEQQLCNEVVQIVKQESEPETDLGVTNKIPCPECGEPIIHEGGCVRCTNCLWSKCD